MASRAPLEAAVADPPATPRVAPIRWSGAAGPDMLHSIR